MDRRKEKSLKKVLCVHLMYTMGSIKNPMAILYIVLSNTVMKTIEVTILSSIISSVNDGDHLVMRLENMH